MTVNASREYRFMQANRNMVFVPKQQKEQLPPHMGLLFLLPLYIYS